MQRLFWYETLWQSIFFVFIIKYHLSLLKKERPQGCSRGWMIYPCLLYTSRLHILLTAVEKRFGHSNGQRPFFLVVLKDRTLEPVSYTHLLVAQELQSWLMEKSPDEVPDQDFGPDQDEQGFGMSMTM